MNSISFITPSRNNLKYLKWSYNSIRKNLGYRHELCWADDASTDGTWEWMVETAEKDQNIKLYRNEGPERLGHTILYDTLVNECATNDIVMIYHADMYACPKLDIEIMIHIDKGVVVSLTRIEPPLHPPGPEKILVDYGIEPEEFDEFKFLREIESLKEDRTTEGIFAPWAIYKEDFQSINGHDPLYAPQSKEDSDIFNRFVLNDYKLVQTWKGFVYHMSCRGSRFKDGAKRNPDGQVFMKGRESSEWLEQNIRSTRNFIRKWGHMVKHDELMKPIIPPKYDVGFKVYNCDENLLRELEPWCSTLYTDLEWTIYHNYIEFEQPNTLYDLRSKLKGILDPVNDVIVEFDAKKLTQGNFQFIVNLSEILADSGETGKMEYEIFKVDIKKLKNYNKELILAK
jgi:glycosyltransferase involved in cell wall biosynthesis